MTAVTAQAIPPRADAVAKPKHSYAWLWALPPLLILAGLFFYPLGEIALHSLMNNEGEFVGFSSWSQVLGDAAVLRATGTTLQIALLSTIACLICGVFIALVLAFVPFRGSQIVVRFIEVVVSFPSFLIPLAFGVLYGRAGVLNSVLASVSGSSDPVINIMSSIPGVILAETAFYTPFVVRPVLASFAMFPKDRIDVASSLGSGPLRIVRKVILPHSWQSIAAAGALVFLMTLNEFGIILFIGAKSVMTLPMMIYTRAIVSFDFSTAAVVACIQLILSLSAYGIYRALLAKRER